MGAERFIEGLVVAGAFSAFAFASGLLIGRVLVGMVRRDSRSDELEALINRRSAFERDLFARADERRKVLSALEGKVRELAAKRAHLRRVVAAKQESPDRVLRLIGQEVKGRRAFIALVVNKYVAKGGAAAAAIDQVWETPQEVLVWAKNLAEAREELEKVYHDSQGYKITKLDEGA